MPEIERLPSVVIVGRPNVGKSTLFNAITGQRRAIVATFRDRKFELIDTGGIIPNDEELIPSEILRQARVALEAGAQIIYVIDGRTEITGPDRELAAIGRDHRTSERRQVDAVECDHRHGPRHRIAGGRNDARCGGRDGGSGRR
jgi:predicted GTPase